MMPNLTRYSVWDRTMRIFHWVNAISVLCFMVIGVLILYAKPLGISGEAKVLLKTIHATIGYVFVLNLLWRLIWGFIGNHYARWKQFLPFGRNYSQPL